MHSGKLIWHVACDESGVDGQKYYGFGSLWMKYQRLAFHCIVIRKGMVDKTYHDGDYDLAMRKHFTKLIQAKIGAIHKAHPQCHCEFRIEVDPLPSRYKKADEAFHKIANSMLKNQFGGDVPIRSVVTKDSKDSEHIQIADFLLGAVMSAFQGKASSPAKLKVAKNIASYLGWESLLHDTRPTERKFNIW